MLIKELVFESKEETYIVQTGPRNVSVKMYVLAFGNVSPDYRDIRPSRSDLQFFKNPNFKRLIVVELTSDRKKAWVFADADTFNDPFPDDLLDKQYFVKINV